MGKRIDGIFITRKFEVVWDLRTIKPGTLTIRPSSLVGCPHALVKNIGSLKKAHIYVMRLLGIQ